jgi:hypothetical protein
MNLAMTARTVQIPVPRPAKRRQQLKPVPSARNHHDIKRTVG